LGFQGFQKSILDSGRSMWLSETGLENGNGLGDNIRPPVVLFQNTKTVCTVLHEISRGYTPVPGTAVGEQNAYHLDHQKKSVVCQFTSAPTLSIGYGDDIYKTYTAAVPQAVLGLSLLLNNGAFQIAECSPFVLRRLSSSVDKRVNLSILRKRYWSAILGDRKL
jgi:hypothetical protein